MAITIGTRVKPWRASIAERIAHTRWTQRIAIVRIPRPTNQANENEVPMSQKIGKMLNKYAPQSGKSSKELKRWWQTLSQHQRAVERARIERELKPKQP